MEKHTQEKTLATAESSEQAQAFDVEEIDIADEEPVTVYGRMQP